MPDPLAGLPPRFLRTPEAARFLGLSGRTLEKHRTYGTGPKYRKIGGRVVYALDDLKAWADLGAKTSTSDPGAGTVFPAKRGATGPRQRTAASPLSGWPMSSVETLVATRCQDQRARGERSCRRCVPTDADPPKRLQLLGRKGVLALVRR